MPKWCWHSSKPWVVCPSKRKPSRKGWLFPFQFLGAAPSDVGAGISIIPYRQQFVKRKVAQSLNSLDARNLCILPIAFWSKVWYTIGVKRRGEPLKGSGASESKPLKKSKKPLDKYPNLWYNVREVKRSPKDTKKNFKEIQKNLLTNP